MFFPTRQLAAAGVAALALGAGAGPALADGGSSSTSAARAKTPLVTKLETERSVSEVGYSNPDCNYAAPSCEVDTSLYRAAQRTQAAARSIDRLRADPAQLPAKLEWVLGADLQSQGDDNLEYAEQYLEDRRNTTDARRMIKAGLVEYRLSNYYLANADSELGVPHLALAAEPYRLLGKDVTAAEKRSLIAQLPTGSLPAAIDSAAPVIRESIPSAVFSIPYTVNAAAATYYGVIFDRLHVATAQRLARTKSVEGMHALRQGDEQLEHAAAISAGPLSATARREIRSAFTTLRRAGSQISQAEALLGLHHQMATIALPTRINGTRGVN